MLGSSKLTTWFTSYEWMPTVGVHAQKVKSKRKMKLRMFAS
jgi:hypothetical protein